MADPSALLWGDLRAQVRYGVLIETLGDARSDDEIRLLVMLARLLSDDEVTTLVHLIEGNSK
jgi:hypothetical protein